MQGINFLCCISKILHPTSFSPDTSYKESEAILNFRMPTFLMSLPTKGEGSEDLNLFSLLQFSIADFSSNEVSHSLPEIEYENRPSQKKKKKSECVKLFFGIEGCQNKKTKLNIHYFTFLCLD